MSTQTVQNSGDYGSAAVTAEAAVVAADQGVNTQEYNSEIDAENTVASDDAVLQAEMIVAQTLGGTPAA